MEYYIVLDVGGTEIKAGLLDENGFLIGETIDSFPSKSDRDSESIIENFVSIIVNQSNKVENALIKGIGLAFPGPFDYENGISYIKNLSKYSSIYGVNLKKELKERLTKANGRVSSSIKISFLHDIEAFALGEAIYGKAKNAGNIFCLCIGTGAGSAFLKDKKIIKNADNVPENGWVYNIPFRDSVIDDYISVRGLEKVSLKHCGEKLSGLQLYNKAVSGNANATACFQEFGEDVKKAVEISTQSFETDTIILGGQITKAFQFWGESLKSFCYNNGVSLIITENTSASTFLGLYSNFIKDRKE